MLLEQTPRICDIWSQSKEDGFWYAVVHAKPTLNVRIRVELADADPKAPPEPNGLERSEAYTLRTRLGYGTKPWHGGMIYAVT